MRAYESLSVYARYQRRGGIDINPFRSSRLRQVNARRTRVSGASSQSISSDSSLWPHSCFALEIAAVAVGHARDVLDRA